jgi:hypothetical protein
MSPVCHHRVTGLESLRGTGPIEWLDALAAGAAAYQ